MSKHHSSDSFIDVERQKQRRRVIWLKQQEREREYERRKREKIKEYERIRAEELRLMCKRRSCEKLLRRTRPEELIVCHLKSETNEICHLSERKKTHVNGSENVGITDPNVLRNVKVIIKQNIPTSTNEAIASQIGVINSSKIILKRREGEGKKPIFEREELKNSEAKLNEVEEHRTIKIMEKLNLEKRLCSHSCSVSPSFPRYHSTSLSPQRYRPVSSGIRRNRSSSPMSVKSDSRRSRNYCDARKNSNDESKRRRRSQEKSHTRDLDHYKSKRDRSCEKTHRDSRKKWTNHTYSSSKRRDSSRERYFPSTCMKQMPLTNHYWMPKGYISRPMLYGPPMPPLRRPMPIRGPVPLVREPMFMVRFPTPMHPPYDPRRTRMF